MTVQTPPTVDRLKSIKNRIIGNPTAKTELSQDIPLLEVLVECLASAYQDAIRIEAAHIITSLSINTGSDNALACLLRADTPRGLLMSLTSPSSPPVQAALARALRSLTAAIADVVGPSVSGLRPETTATLRNDARIALDEIFMVETLDVVLPLLGHHHYSDGVAVSIAQLLARSLRVAQHRTAVTEWLPSDERAKESRSRRGWEKLSAHGVNAPARQGGWVTRNLKTMLDSRAHKVQEAALLALGTLAKENVAIASALTEHQGLASVVNILAKSRSPDLQLAACLCATHIIRASPQPNDSIASMVISVLNRFISPPSTFSTASTSVSIQQQRQACNILHHLVIDDPPLCKLAFTRGCLNNLARLLSSLTIIPSGEPHTLTDIVGDSGKDRKPNTISESSDEPPSLSVLREAILTALAALALLQHEIRMALTELDLGEVPMHPALTASSDFVASEGASNGEYTPTLNGGKHKELLALLRLTIKSPHPGIRYATAELMRALTRSVAVLRTSVVDSGLGQLILERVMDPKEDRRVVGAALKAVCNGVCEFSPLRDGYVKEGLVERLVKFIRGIEPFDAVEGSHSPVLDTSLRPIALWAIKNLVKKSDDNKKSKVMTELGWGTLAELMVSGKLESRGRLRRVLREKKAKNRRESVMGGIVGSMDIDGESDVMVQNAVDDSSDTEEEMEQEEADMDQDIPAVQEQAIHIVRNLSENESGIDMVFGEFGKINLLDIPFFATQESKMPSASFSSLPSPTSTASFPTLSPAPPRISPSLHPIIAILTTILSAPPSAAPDITLQATFTLANLSNGSPSQQALILSHPPLLRAIRNVLAESGRGFEGGDVRKPAVGAVLALAKGCAGVVSSAGSSHGFGGDASKVITSARCRKEMSEAGVLGTLKRICESQGGVVGVGIGMVHHHPHHHPTSAGSKVGLGHSHSYSATPAISGGPSTSPTTPTHSHLVAHAAPLMDTDKEVVELARSALDWLDHDVYGGTVM
ncbi:armadillo repeat protein [Moniliophthora roreri MCA 2997]|uniref:Armadillo repeat protein n=2 Tax=Moniliophthora roreri TaxID=221103 RepID=V2WKZ9_MONRO|nr:armadillo repeat protein [Moniliophthora roreri MCA 2997]KAI3610742.1 armadillo repeat protein [Moniliophthora roreri]